MEDDVMSTTLLAALAGFAGNLLIGIGLLIAFLIAYMRATPHEEVALIRDGNAAAAVGLAGAIVGFAIVLSRVLASGASLWEMLLWGLIGLVVQVGGHFLVRAMFPDFQAEIEKGSWPAAIMLATTGVVFGMINAASLTA
jgi:putative membrane protein